MESTRAFVAAELGWPARSVLEQVIKQLKSKVSGVRWSHPDQLHLTLKFVGVIDNRLLPQLCDRVRQACSSYPAFSIQVTGIGTFPKNKPPRILWAGVEQGTAELRDLAQRLDDQLADLGIPRETRLFTPHLTLGRVGRDADVAQLQSAIALLPNPPALHCEIDEIVLMSSVKQQGDMIYEPIDTVELGG